MSIKRNLKRNVLLLIAMFFVIFGLISPVVTANAGLEEAKQKLEEEVTKYLKDAKEAKDIVRIMEEDNEENPNPDRDSISYVMKRLLYPGVYVNDVRDGVLASEIELDKSDILYNGGYACNPQMPNNLLNHNCNIPNFTTGLIQNMVDGYSTPFANAETTSAYSVFGLGVPSDIPGGTVPVKASDRSHTYTALELYGYDLKLTNYFGEWDNVVVSNEARMLSNFGFIDKVTLVGTGIWNSVSSGMSTFVDNFSFNPVRWFGSIGKSFESGASSGINTVVDTSELNIVATNAWKRPRLDSSLYNVYVMTDAEILRETALNYFKIFSDEFDMKIKSNAELKEAIAINPESALNSTPFSYDPEWETKESKASREKAEAKRESEKAHNEAERLKEAHSSDGYKADIISPLTKIPAKKFYTESQQLGFWSEDPAVKKTIGIAKKNSLLNKDPKEYKTYASMMSEWKDKYTPYFEGKFNALGETIDKMLKELDSDVFQKYPHLDPKQSISRYACANPNGTIKRNNDGTVAYMYSKNNVDTEEFVNPDCGEARPPIGGGLLGHGWTKSEITDTRHITNVSEDGSIQKNAVAALGTGVLMINSNLAKFTNVLLDLAFSPIMSELGINKLITELISGFSKTVFFPLAALAATVGAFLFFLQVLKSKNLMEILTSLGIAILGFAIGVILLANPSQTIKTIEDIPNAIDKSIAKFILDDEDGSEYCSTGKDDNGLRSAQCNVWGALVFEPWVNLQFGTSFNNLYAQGYKTGDKQGFKNSNTELVGNATVNMGGGKYTHNWALYQLEVTKAGTINSKPTSKTLGTVDKNLYKLVDLQAGPDNAAKSDSHLFKAWSGAERESFAVILSLIQAVLMTAAISFAAFAKIEATFIFTLLLLFFPVFLIVSLMPKGRFKLVGYLSNMGSLLLRKIMLTFFIAVLLKVVTVSYSVTDNFTTSATFGIFISLAFIMYRKEVINLITFNNAGAGMIGANVDQIREIAKNAIPKGIKQAYSETRANLKGATVGVIGGSIGAAGQNMAIKRERSSIRKKIESIDKELAKNGNSEELLKEKSKLEEKDKAIAVAMERRKSMSASKAAELEDEYRDIEAQIQENEIKIRELIADGQSSKNAKEIAELNDKNEALEKAQEELSIQYAGGERSSMGVVAQALKGSAHSRNVIGTKMERELRRKGFATLTSIRDVTENVYNEGARNISEGSDDVAHDVYKDILRETKNSHDSSNDNIDAAQLESPQVQRRIRELAKERRQKQGTLDTALKFNLEEIEKVASYIDNSRTVDKLKMGTVNPLSALEMHERDKELRENLSNRISDTSTIAKQIKEDIENKNLAGKDNERNVYYDSHGEIVTQDEIEDKERFENLKERRAQADEAVEKAVRDARDKLNIESTKENNDEKEEK